MRATVLERASLQLATRRGARGEVVRVLVGSRRGSTVERSVAWLRGRQRLLDSEGSERRWFMVWHMHSAMRVSPYRQAARAATRPRKPDSAGVWTRTAARNGACRAAAQTGNRPAEIALL